jgi:hypothetical protein
MKIINFENFLDWLEINFDKETNQYYVINDLTPGVYGIGNTKKQAIDEYFSALKDMVLSYLLKENDEVKTYK